MEVEFAKVYDLDPRKYSRYYEASYYSGTYNNLLKLFILKEASKLTDKLDSGITGEASIIWSPRSFVPRSASADLTANVLGQTVNLFEVSFGLNCSNSFK